MKGYFFEPPKPQAWKNVLTFQEQAVLVAAAGGGKLHHVPGGHRLHAVRRAGRYQPGLRQRRNQGRLRVQLQL